MDFPWLDRVLLRIAPRWAARRAQARVTAALFQRHYEGAAMGRRTQGWNRHAGDANAANGPALGRLRQTARDLVRNNPYAANAVDTMADHTVGWGIVAKPARGSTAKATANRAKAVWNAWANTTACDADGRHDFAGLQKLVMRAVIESGEVLVRLRPRRPEDDLPIPLQLQVLEADFLDDTMRDGQVLPGGGRIIQGVEFNAIGQRVAYWLHREHPGSALSGATFGQSDRIPADRVLHVFRATRPGQVRGASWFAPIMLRLRDFDEYEDAALLKQKIAACLAVLTTDVNGTAPPVGGLDPGRPELDSLEPGMILNVPVGRTVNVVQPPTVSEHGDYAATTLRAIATGLGLTYEDLTGDYCIAPETRVLRGDLRWVRADELHEGDALVAFDEHRPPGRGKRRKWRHAAVVRTGRRELPRVRVTTDKTSVTVSREHMFLGHIWVRADELKPGDKIAFLAEPWEEGHTHLHGYLKGIADGEGYVHSKSARIGLCQQPGDVCDEIGAALKILGFKARLHGKANNSGTLTWDVIGIADCLRFLGEVRPTRLLKKARSVYDGIATSGGMGKRGAQTHATVLSAEADGVGPVVTLATTTHTVITEGLCSHNTDMPFSAARMSRLRHWARVEDWRWRMLIPQFCEPVWREAMAMAGVMGLPEAPAAEWTASPAPMIEPDREGLAYQRNIRTGIMSLSEAIRERGYDPEELLTELSEDFKLLDRLGLRLDCDPRTTTQAGNPTEAVSPSGRPIAAPSNGNGNGEDA